MITSSITGTRPQILVGLAAVMLLLGGCSTGVQASSQKPTASSQTETQLTNQEPGEPSTFTKVKEDDLADVHIEALTDVVAWDEVSKASRRSADPIQGEHFAVLAAQYLTDSRGHEVPASRIDQLLDGPDTLRAYLIADHAGQVALDTKRYIDPRISSWVRSEIEDEGAVVRTQLNAFGRASVGGEPADRWVRFRVDVRHDGDRWWLTGFNNAGALGAGNVELTDRQKELYFYSGEGWRRIPASK